MILRGDGGSVPQPGNAAGRPVECHEDNVIEHGRQDSGARSILTAGPETHYGHNFQAVSVCCINPSVQQKWASIECFDLHM
jgi:hypothetical protein